MKRVAAVFGTRAEAIKLAPLIVSMRDHADLDCHVCVTALSRQKPDFLLVQGDTTTVFCAAEGSPELALGARHLR